LAAAVDRLVRASWKHIGPEMMEEDTGSSCGGDDITDEGE